MADLELLSFVYENVHHGDSRFLLVLKSIVCIVKGKGKHQILIYSQKKEKIQQVHLFCVVHAPFPPSPEFRSVGVPG